MVFLSIYFLLCYYTVILHFFVKKLFSDVAVEAVVFIDLVVNIHREFVRSLVNST